VDWKPLTGADLGIKNTWSLCLQAFFFSDLLAKLLFNVGTNNLQKAMFIHILDFKTEPVTKLLDGFFMIGFNPFLAFFP
jgi:hypothetical protein